MAKKQVLIGRDLTLIAMSFLQRETSYKVQNEGFFDADQGL